MWPGDTPDQLPQVNLLPFRVRRVGGGVGGQVLTGLPAGCLIKKLGGEQGAEELALGRRAGTSLRVVRTP